jgi:hypothetical protein
LAVLPSGERPCSYKRQLVKEDLEPLVSMAVESEIASGAAAAESVV